MIELDITMTIPTIVKRLWYILGNVPLSGNWHHTIPYKYLRVVTTDDLWKRKENIEFEIGGRLLQIPKDERPSFEDRYQLLLELAYIENILMDRLFVARFDAKNNSGAKVFISHSSKDRQFAKWLSNRSGKFGASTMA